MRSSSSEIPRNPGRLRIDARIATPSVAQSPSGTSKGIPRSVPIKPSATWKSVAVLPIPGGATRIKSSSDTTMRASSAVFTESSKSSALKVSGTEVGGHRIVLRKTSRSALAAARMRFTVWAFEMSGDRSTTASRSTRARDSISARRFHSCRTSTVNAASGASMARPWSLHIHMPLVDEARCSADIVASYRGPPAAAAEMCAAVPVSMTPSPSSVAPTVCERHAGNEHSQPARFAILNLVAAVKSSRVLLATCAL